MNRTISKRLSKYLLEEWHPTKNLGINPIDLTAKSGMRSWWLCKQCHHEWQAPIYHRSNGTSCPKCKPKRIWVKRLKSILDLRGSFKDQQPQLALEWHPEKNGLITPDKITASSGKKFWWKCSKGEDHEWESSASNRIKGKGCPVCSGRKAVLSNCLSTTHPEVAKEWHPHKNQELLPTSVTFGSHKKVWWQCKNGHEWAVAVSNRTSKGKSECPFCLKLDIGQRRVRSLIKRNGSLAEVAPEIAKQWHPEKNGLKTPLNFTVGSSYRAWWRCDKGHEWCVPINARKSHGCPKCSYQTSQLEIRIYCELKNIFTDASWRERIAGNECDIFLPSHKIAFEIDGFPWHKDREPHDKIKNDLLLNQGVVLFRVRDNRLFQTSNNDIFYQNRESHLEIIYRILKHIQKQIPLSCLEQSKIESYLLSKKFVDDESFKKILNDVWTVPESESVAALFPNLNLEWDYEKNGHLNPKRFSPGSELSVYWKCQVKSAHKWKSKIKDRVRNKGCPFCRGKRVCLDNSLATLNPSLAAQWCYEKNGKLIPSQVTAGSSRKVYWTCECGSSWKASVWHRNQSKNSQCLACYNKNIRGKSQINKAVQKNGSFADNFPKLAKEWHPIKNGPRLPTSLSCGSNLKVWWKCPKGVDHEWENSIVARIQASTCPFCSGKKVSLENSLKHNLPELANEWNLNRNTITPSEITKCSGKKVWWQCAKGHEWEATVSSRAAGRKCPYCQGKKASSDENLGSLYPHLLTEWHESKNYPRQPIDFRPKANVKVWWRCSQNNNHEWEAVIASRTDGRGCPFCNGKRTSEAYSLASVNPTLAKEWHPDKNNLLSPNDVTPNSGRKVWWKCVNGHSWEANINNRSRGRGCRLCRKTKKQRVKNSD